jgi:hypothetical protein
MSNINRSGTFRGDVIDRGLSKSSGGHLQFEVQLQATEKWNLDAEVWEPWDYDEVEATAYLNLITGKEKANSVNIRQIMRAFNWDGVTWATLQDENAPLAKQIQFRIESNEYDGKTRLQVAWVDAYDAAPGKKVQKLSAVDIRSIDSQYAAVLKSVGGGPKPKSARPSAPVSAPVSADPTPDVTAPTTTPTATLLGPPKRQRATKAEMEARRAVPAPATPTPPPTDVAVDQAETVPISQVDAWEVVKNKAQKAGKTDMEISNAWTEVVKGVGGDAAVGEDWSNVRADILTRLGL